jgi:two-component system response regulator YesN
MLQLLIVDDEAIAVEGIKSGVDWESVGVSRLMTAYSAEQAKTIFRSERVDILLCDIEMPQGTGLELLEWVRGHSPRTETIFLTCHADFQYAKQAIKLGSLDYLLKPIPYGDLMEAVRKAGRKIEQDSETNAYSQYGRYWMQHQPLLIERFWHDILKQSIPAKPGAIARAAEERNIPYAEEMTFLPVLIPIRRWHISISLRDEKIMEYAVRKSAEEVIVTQPESGLLVSLEDGRMLAIISGGTPLADVGRLREACERYIRACRDYFYCDVSCYIGDEVQPHEMAAMVQQLLRQDADNVAYDSRVFGLHEGAAPRVLSPLRTPDTGLWAAMLTEGAHDKVVAEAERHIAELARVNQLTGESLRPFLQDFQQMVHYVLQVKGIQAHLLFSDPESMEMYARAARSAIDAQEWIRRIVRKSMDFAASVAQTTSVVDQTKAYINRHLAEPISREDIAGHVYLNPDYLTRIFKKETGMSISDYLLQQRLHVAAGLLADTDMAVSAIAAKIGYSNFSHFARMFKKIWGLNPVDYRLSRQQHRESGESRENGREKS